jgi:hypothetical protein
MAHLYIDILPTVFKIVIFHSHVKLPDGSKSVKSSKSHPISLHVFYYIILLHATTRKDPAKKQQKSSIVILIISTSYSILYWNNLAYSN